MTDPAVAEPRAAERPDPPRRRTRSARDDEGRILLARLSAIEVDVGAWTLPGGGVDFGEHPDAAAIRELEEETGLDRRDRGDRGRLLARVPTVERSPRAPTSTSSASSTTCGSSAASCATRSTARPTRRVVRPRRPRRHAARRARPVRRSGWPSRDPTPDEEHDRDRRRRAGRSSSSGSPATSSAGRGCSPTTSRSGRSRREAGGRARRPRWSPAGRSCRSLGPRRCRSPGGRGRGRRAGRSGCGSSTGRRDRTAWTSRGGSRPRGAGSRVEIDHDFRPRVAALGRVHRPRLHPPDRVADARDVQGDRRGGGEPTSTGRRVWITGHRRRHRDRDRRRRVPGGAARRPLADQADRPVRPVAVPLARSPPRSTTSTRSRGCRRRPPASSTGSASSGSSPGSSRSTTPGCGRARTAPRRRERIGIYLGSALGGIAYAEEQHERYLERGHPAGRAEPRPRGVRRRGAGQPRDRARRPRADPLDRQLVRLAARSRSARRSARSGPARSTRRSPAASRSR